MRKTITTIMTMAAMLFAVNANAQKEFVYEFTSICGEYYESYTQTLDEEAIAAEIGCPLADASVFAVQSDGTLDPDYKLGTTDGWRNADGDWESWGSDARICVKADFAPVADEDGNKDPHIYYIGGMTGQTGTPATYKATYRIENPSDNTKYCFVIIKLTYEELPTYRLDELNIVKKFEIVAEEYPRSNTAAETFGIKVGDLASLIGYDAERFNSVWFKQLLYVGQLDENEVKSDVLTNLNYSSTAWMNALFDENTGLETEECVQGTSGDPTKFSIHFSSTGYDGDTLKVNVGQSGKLKVGDTNFAKVYLVGTDKKAVEITVRIKIIPKDIEDLPWDQKTCVGSETVSLIRDIDAGYSVTAYTIKIDSIVGLFKAGTVVADLEFTALDADGNPTTASTTGEGKNGTAAGGFWMDMESHPMEWTTSVKSYFVNNYNTRIEIGHMDNSSLWEGGEKTTGSLFYVLDNEYYELKMDIQIGEKEDTTKVITKPEECAIVATKYYTYRIVPNNNGEYQNYGSNAAGERDYHLMDKPIDADINFIEAQLGTASPTFYGEVIDTLGNATYSKNYSCDPKPGFWMSPAEKIENKSSVSDWYASQQTYGICYANGVFQFFQYPGKQSVGAKYVDNFYLVNQDAGKQIKYVITVIYVEQIQAEAETVETFALNLPARDAADTENGTYTPYDLTPMYEAFGCTPEEFAENGTWMAIDSDGDLSNNYDELEGFAFDANSKLSDDDASLVALVGYIAEENGFFSWILDDENLAKTYTFTIYAYYNNQRCEFNITVGDASAINFVELNKSDGKIFDLTGRLVKNATKGIYIKDGKKFLVK
ncbi:MAG: DUF4859 domain-containing protein [Bacteroidaceae bacterium]|nr:DUF4859 domain-containing protein [Bacteroidaceae bacterium]